MASTGYSTGLGEGSQDNGQAPLLTGLTNGQLGNPGRKVGDDHSVCSDASRSLLLHFSQPGLSLHKKMLSQSFDVFFAPQKRGENKTQQTLFEEFWKMFKIVS